MRLRSSWIVALVGFGLLPVAGFGAAPTNVGEKIPAVTFRDGTGKLLPLTELRDKKAIVVVFLSFECPVSTSYLQPLADMAAAFEKQGVVFLGLTTDQDETA